MIRMIYGYDSSKVKLITMNFCLRFCTTSLVYYRRDYSSLVHQRHIGLVQETTGKFDLIIIVEGSWGGREGQI